VFVLGLGWFLLEWLKEAGPRWRWVQNLSEAYHKRKAENEDAPKEEVRKEEDDTPRPASLGYGTMQQ
jgi:hypothetical protein